MQVEGQIYIPEINWLMMVLTVVVVAIFKTTTQLGNAYGESHADGSYPACMFCVHRHLKLQTAAVPHILHRAERAPCMRFILCADGNEVACLAAKLVRNGDLLLLTGVCILWQCQLACNVQPAELMSHVQVWLCLP